MEAIFGPSHQVANYATWLQFMSMPPDERFNPDPDRNPKPDPNSIHDFEENGPLHGSAQSN